MTANKRSFQLVDIGPRDFVNKGERAEKIAKMPAGLFAIFSCRVAPRAAEGGTLRKSRGIFFDVHAVGKNI